MNESISVMTDAGELVATPFAGGISVDINLPDGKGSGQLAFIEAAPEGLRDDYPTPVHVFTYDGRDSEPVHRTDVHLDGDAMTLDPVKGAAARNGADTGYSQLDSDFVNASNSWDEVYGFIKRSDPNAPGMPASFDYALLALDSNGWHFGESSASAFDIPRQGISIFFLGIFYCSSISEFATYASECNEPDFQEWLCSMYLRDQVEDRLRHEISCNCMTTSISAGSPSRPRSYLSVKSLYFEGDVVDSALDWQADYLPCVCHRGGQGENDRWEYEPTDDYRPFTRPADIPESIFDKLCASQGTTIEKVVNDPVTKFERSFREDIFNSQQNSLVGLTVLATLPLDAFLDASLSMICRGDRKKAGAFTVKPGTYEPIMGIYDPINGCGGTAGIEPRHGLRYRPA